ncbi:hypothetical protein NMY22_g15349 [Coprinellus aureogranulatus]|nr:hypothetical protein NMY22_g15349 [Coprinellus aureogranulatus]
MSVKQIQLGGEQEGKISGVSVYSDRAEISRPYRFLVVAGQNKVIILGLPYTLDESSVCVEGKGEATIHGVTISPTTSDPTPPTTSPELVALEDKREEATVSLSRYTKMLARLDRYLESRTEHHGGTHNAIPEDVLPLLDSYGLVVEKYDAKVLALNRELKTIDKDIAEAQSALQKLVDVNPSRPLKATISLRDWRGKPETTVRNRAHTELEETPVEVSYKAAIQQDTGEDWTDVSITLETAKPSFGLTLPALNTWNISVYNPPPAPPPPAPAAFAPPASSYRRAGYSVIWQMSSEKEDQRISSSARRSHAPPPPPSRRQVAMQFAAASVASNGNVNTTFKVPGLFSIPSDGVAHNVTIANLKPEAKLSWLAVSQVNTRVHLTTRIKNNSEYTLLAGPSSVYVDRSDVAKSAISLVSPQETFTCALWYVSPFPPFVISTHRPLLRLDPSIRLSTPPQTKNFSTSGLLSKTSLTSFTQRITMHKTTATAIKDLKILARIPVSQDAQINVKLVSPSLPSPSGPPTSSSRDLSH